MPAGIGRLVVDRSTPGREAHQQKQIEMLTALGATIEFVILSRPVPFLTKAGLLSKPNLEPKPLRKVFVTAPGVLTRLVSAPNVFPAFHAL